MSTTAPEGQRTSGSSLTLTDALLEVLKFVNDWLQFAEKKNGVLIAADLAVAMALLRAMWSMRAEEPVVAVALAFSALLFLLAALASFASFLPRLKLPWLFTRDQAPQEDFNVVFFGHAAQFSPEDYLSKLSKSIGCATAPSPFERQLAEQVVMNSRIAEWKYRWFSWAAWITICAVLTPIVGLPLWWAWNRRIAMKEAD